MLNRLPNFNLGCDPEFFIERDGVIIGSEKVIPSVGVPIKTLPYGYLNTKALVQDGVQIEMNPAAQPHVSSLAGQFTGTFKHFKSMLVNHPGVKPNFNGVVKVTRTELKSLSEKSRELGCQESLNVYDPAAKVGISGQTYLKRSAGGHIHLGLNQVGQIYSPIAHRDLRFRVVPNLDIFLANFCVMFNRDPGQKERRKYYGRAGEYRLPTYGLEYRTLSNFWIRSYPLMDFVYGMARLAVSVVSTSLSGTDVEQELVDTIKIKKLIRGINHNDPDLASDNYEIAKAFIRRHVPHKVEFPLHAGNLDQMDRFIDQVDRNGIESFWPDDPMTYWDRYDQNKDMIPFEQFLRTI